jgi:hypothetical protein
MVEQCEFQGGDKFQCNPTKGLKALKEQMGNGFSVSELKKLVCESSINNDCPAFDSLKVLGAKSEFARKMT